MQILFQHFGLEIIAKVELMKIKNVVVSNEPLQAKSKSDTNEVPSENNSRDSQKIFSPELMMASSNNKPTYWKFPSNPTEIDKLELCKRILKDNFPTDEGDDAKNTFNRRLSEYFKKIIEKKAIIGIDCKLKFSNQDDDKSINQIASQLNGLQNINDEQLKERIDIILENLNNKEAFKHYMGFYPKTPPGSRESSPERGSGRESSPGALPRGPFSPAGSMTPPFSISRGGAFFSRSPSSISTISTDSQIR
ncbi:MAG: hypothetical protein ACO201_03970 [Rickettsiales bacterium]